MTNRPISSSSSPPLLARLALDAQESILAAAAAVPSHFHDRSPAELNSAAWIVTHAAESHQVWICEYVGGLGRDAWFDAFRKDPKQVPPFAVAHDALRRVIEQSTAVLAALTQSDLAGPGQMLETSRWAGWTAGQLIARTVAHFYVHAADLATLTNLAGGKDLGLPGAMIHVRSAP
jgi:hypothetical protein